MINLDQIEEWIHEVEERPGSAPLIVEYVAKRLKELSARNEELLAENIELRTGRKVEEYESRIANLEYQLDLLKRQLGASAGMAIPAAPVETVSLLIYNPTGRVLRIEAPTAGLKSGSALGRFAARADAGGPPRLLVTSAVEELLFVFDTGRTVALPVTEIPEMAPGAAVLDWQTAYLVEPHGGEELAVILPVARMSLFDYCVQASRRGLVKKMMKTSFEQHVAKSFVGSGIKAKPDKTCTLALCGRDDLFVLASREGYIAALEVAQLPYTIEEVLKLGPTDYLMAGFPLSTGTGGKPSILVMTNSGKLIHREAGWLEKANSFKSRGQAVFSQARREGGVRVISAAGVEESDWSAALDTSGAVSVHQISDLLSAGALTLEEPGGEVLDFTVFSAPKA